MTTVRQIERQWKAKEYQQLFADLVAPRPEGTLRLGIDTSIAAPAAAMALIRLDELNQAHASLYSTMLRAVLAAQEADGGWGDPVSTALCLRALLCSGGQGLAVDRALTYLAQLQKTNGLWPNIPIRRMPADPYVSALILFELRDDRQFREAVRFDDATGWFVEHETELDPDCRKLWDSVRTRLGRIAGRADILFRPDGGVVFQRLSAPASKKPPACDGPADYRPSAQAAR